MMFAKKKSPMQKKSGLLETMPAIDQAFECFSTDSVDDFNYYNSQKKYLHFLIDHAFRCIWAFLSKNV